LSSNARRGSAKSSKAKRRSSFCGRRCIESAFRERFLRRRDDRFRAAKSRELCGWPERVVSGNQAGRECCNPGILETNGSRVSSALSVLLSLRITPVGRRGERIEKRLRVSAGFG